MPTLKEMVWKDEKGKETHFDIGASAEERKNWNKKVDPDGDVSETTVSNLEETQASFPQPVVGDKQETLWGKLKKWQQDCIAKFGNYVLTSMVTNQHLNSTSNIPTSALVYLMQQAIQQNQSAINVLNTKQNNQCFYMHHLFSGEAHYNQSYPANGKFDDYEFYQVEIGWKRVLCVRNWYSDTKNALVGGTVYTCAEYTDFYRFEIIFNNTNATSFYTNALTVRRLYPDGRQEYNDQTVILNTISGIKVAPR